MLQFAVEDPVVLHSERPKRNFTDTEPKPKHELFTEPKPKLNTEIITNTIEYE